MMNVFEKKAKTAKILGNVYENVAGEFVGDCRWSNLHLMDGADIEWDNSKRESEVFFELKPYLSVEGREVWELYKHVLDALAKM